MNAYEIADQMINAPFDTSFDEPVIDVRELRDDEAALAEREEIEEAAQKIADILAGNKPKAKKDVKTAKSAKTPKVRAEKAPSKMDAARELYASLEDKSRKNVLDQFSAQLGMSTAMASTYFYKIR